MVATKQFTKGELVDILIALDSKASDLQVETNNVRDSARFRDMTDEERIQIKEMQREHKRYLKLIEKAKALLT